MHILHIASDRALLRRRAPLRPRKPNNSTPTEKHRNKTPSIKPPAPRPYPAPGSVFPDQEWG
jgi:hypothetical protein